MKKQSLDTKVLSLYWRSSERRGAWALLFFLVLLCALSSGFLILFSILMGELTTPLATQDWSAFQQTLALSLVFAIVAIPMTALKPFVQSKLSWHWRRWLTQHFLDRYFDAEHYYYLGFVPEIDNPDQRIAEDIKNYTQESLVFFVAIIEAVFQLIGFSGLIWSTSKPLMVVLIVYAIVINVITIGGFGRKLVMLNLNQLQRETTLRFGLARSRDYAESIAFYQGEFQESQQVKNDLTQVIRNFDRILTWQFWLDIVQTSYQFMPFFIPLMILTPEILAGSQPVGAFVQSSIAFKSLVNALAVIINQLEQVSAFTAGILRLESLSNFFQQPQTQEIRVQEIQSQEIQSQTASNAFVIRDLSLRLRSQEKNILESLNITVQNGESLLIMGRSGSGKTTLLRAIAGLWRTGSGEIQRPERSEILFLPQKPYLSQGSLRSQLMYPRVQPKDDAALLQVLEQVNLVNLIKEGEGFDRIADWGQQLSGGEQQRLAFARLLIQSPRYAILDEATSALDETNETLLYSLLKQTNITYISVGHRSTLIVFHDRMIRL